MKKLTIHWLNLAQSDYDSALYLYSGAHYPQAIYILCQSIEKILKACQVEYTETAPAKIHRLENIAKETTLTLSDKQYEQLTDLSKHYSRVRYPDISQTSYNTLEKVTPIIETGKELYLWIQAQLQNR